MSVWIGRLRNVFVAPREEGRPADVRARMEAVVRRSTQEALGRSLEHALDAADPAVWVIRRLRMAFPLQARRTEALVATAWARGVAGGIARALVRGPDGENVLKFPHRAAYLAWLVRRVARGSAAAGGGQIDSLRALAPGAAVLALVSREPDLADAILRALVQQAALADVVRVLDERQADAWLQMIVPAAAEPAAADVEKVAAIVVAEPAIIEETPARTTLALYVEARRRHPDLPPAVVRTAVERVVAALPDLVSQRDAAGWIDALATSALPPVDQVAGARPLPADRSGVDPTPDRDAFNRPVHRRMPPPAARTPRASPVSFLTEFGGWFLLLPGYLALGVEDLLARNRLDAPGVRWLLARLCLGPRGRLAKVDDEGLLWASGLERSPDESAVPLLAEPVLEEWLRSLPDEAARGTAAGHDREYFGAGVLERSWTPVARRLLAAFARRLPGFAHSSPPHLDRNVFDGRTSVRHVAGGVDVTLLPRPLDVVLRMAAIDGDVCLLPWKDHARVTIRLG